MRDCRLKEGETDKAQKRGIFLTFTFFRALSRRFCPKQLLQQLIHIHSLMKVGAMKG